MNKKFFLLVVLGVLLTSIGADALVDMIFRSQIQWGSNITFSIISTTIFALVGYSVFFNKQTQKTDEVG
jgi:hypothetical protein